MTTSRIAWSRIFVEGSVIVVSILLAFAIDAWWDDRQEANAEAAAIARILDEFESALEEFDEVESLHELTYAAGLALIEIADGRQLPDTGFAGQVRLALSTEARLDLPTYALDGYLATAARNGSPNSPLRKQLAGYRSLLDQVWQQEAMTRDLVRDDIMLAVSARSNLLAVGLGSRSEEFATLWDNAWRDGAEREMLALVQDPLIRNLVAARTGREWVAYSRTKRLREQYDELIPALEEAAEGR